MNSIANMELKELKVQLAQWKKKEKITDIVVEHKRNGKRGIHDCQYDVGRIEYTSIIEVDEAENT